MNCKHCHRPIVPVNWANGPGWSHQRPGEPHTTRVCWGTAPAERRTFAAPAPNPPAAIPQPAEHRYEETLAPDELEN